MDPAPDQATEIVRRWRTKPSAEKRQLLNRWISQAIKDELRLAAERGNYPVAKALRALPDFNGTEELRELYVLASRQALQPLPIPTVKQDRQTMIEFMSAYFCLLSTLEEWKAATVDDEDKSIQFLTGLITGVRLCGNVQFEKDLLDSCGH